jgi:hypothetical protein
MALIIHRRTAAPASRPRLLLVGGDGRWARPLLRLVEAFGYESTWAETDPSPDDVAAHDVVLAGSVPVASRLLGAPGAPSTPRVVVLTGSLLSLSTSVRAPSMRSLPWPITRESLEAALEPDPRTAEAA